jgi:AAA domain
MRVVCFYSYKGGVGRSLCLLNTASLLAESGQRVLCVDFDFEAPGLHHKVSATVAGGVLEAVLTGDYLQHIYRVDAKHGSYELLSAGTSDVREYWRLYSGLMTGAQTHVDELDAVIYGLIGTERWDYILVDCRTGISEYAGSLGTRLATHFLVLSTESIESMQGCRAVASSIRLGAQKQSHQVAIQGIWSRTDPLLSSLKEPLVGSALLELPEDDSIRLTGLIASEAPDGLTPLVSAYIAVARCLGAEVRPSLDRVAEATAISNISSRERLRRLADLWGMGSVKAGLEILPFLPVEFGTVRLALAAWILISGTEIEASLVVERILTFREMDGASASEFTQTFETLSNVEPSAYRALFKSMFENASELEVWQLLRFVQDKELRLSLAEVAPRSFFTSELAYVRVLLDTKPDAALAHAWHLGINTKERAAVLSLVASAALGSMASGWVDEIIAADFLDGPLVWKAMAARGESAVADLRLAAAIGRAEGTGRLKRLLRECEGAGIGSTAKRILDSLNFPE